MIRRLYLMNQAGNRFYFDYRSGCLISTLAGLGFSQELTYLKYDQFYDRVAADQPISEVQAVLTFLKGYRGYTEFLEYLKMGDKDLKLYYETHDGAFCYVDVKSLGKQELVAGVLQSQVIFQKRSLWLKEQVYTIDVNVDKVGKVYPYLYPYRYSVSYQGKIMVHNRGVFPAPLFITIYGAVSDPEIHILKGGSTLSTLRLYHTQEVGVTIVSSLPTNQYMHSIVEGITLSIYEKQDFSTDNFLFVEPGEYEIEFRPGVSSATFCRITMLEGYLGV
jgi:hypothetical protein